MIEFFLIDFYKFYIIINFMKFQAIMACCPITIGRIGSSNVEYLESSSIFKTKKWRLNF